MPDVYLPIKVVFPMAEDFRVPCSAPRDWKPLCNVTDRLRLSLTEQIESAAKSILADFPEWSTIPAVVQVTLREDAQAKSYRPTEIFNAQTCPVIGTGRA